MREIPSGWTSSTLGELTEIVSGSTPKTGVSEYWGGDIAWITPDDLSRNRSKTVVQGARSLTRAGYDSCSATLMKAGAVLYTSRAPIGYVAIAGDRVCTNQGFKSFVPGGAVASEYLYWFLKHATPRIRELGSGTTFPELSKKAAATVKVELAPLAEQRRIVAAIEEQFSRLDAADLSLAAALLRLRALAGDQIELTARGHATTPLRELLAEPLSNGRSVRTLEGGFPVLRLSALGGRNIDLSESKPGEWDAEQARPWVVARDDFLVSRGNGSLHLVGRGGLVASEAHVAFPDTMIRIRARRDRLRGAFLRAVWDSRFIRGQIEGSARTTAGIYKISQQTLSNVCVPVPSLEVQDRIVAEVEQRLSVIDAMSNAITSAQRRSAALRRSILERAFRGELVPQDPSDEPASVLLDRIRAERATEARQAPRSGRSRGQSPPSIAENPDGGGFLARRTSDTRLANPTETDQDVIAVHERRR